jgi:hypothetical protein
VRSARDATPSYPYDDDDDEDEDEEDDAPAVAAAAAPSPFTAALARMVSGDRDVRQAVEDALEQPATASARTATQSWPTWSGPIRTAEPSVPSPPAARQKEETVGDQVIAPPSMSAARPAEVPAWATDPDTTSDSSREEAIAEVLRSALAQEHSDEALAGILRKVLAGATPQTALIEPHVAQPAPAFADLLMRQMPAALPADAADDAPDLTRGAATGSTADLPLTSLFPIDQPAEPSCLVPPATESAGVMLPSLEQPHMALPPVEPAPVAQPASELPRIDLFGSTVAAQEPARTWARTASQSGLWGTPTTAPNRAEVAVPEPVVANGAASLFGILPEAAVVIAEPVLADQDSAHDAGAAAYEPVAEAEPELVAEESAGSPLLLELAPLLARTASDPAPMTLDATTVMPPLSLLPPLPGTRGRGRPPVPPAAPRLPSSRAAAASAAAMEPAPTSASAPSDTPTRTSPAATFLATVTRLPVAPPTETPETPETPEMPELADTAAADPAAEDARVQAPGTPSVVDEPPAPHVVPDAVAVPRPAAVAPLLSFPTESGDLVGRLHALGLPTDLLGSSFAEEVAAHGTYAALTRALALRLPKAPELPTGAEVLFVVGPGVETLRAARSLAATLLLDPERVQWATRGDLAGLAPESSRVTTIDAAIDRRQATAAAGSLTIVAVEAPMRTDAYWMAQMLAVWSPVAVWAVVEATRKPEDLEPWLAGLPRMDALIVQDTDLSADPAAVLRRVAAPVAVLDGARATPHRWASLLCERLEAAPR